MLIITQNQLITAAVAAELYLFGQKFIDRPESYCATHSKNCIFISQKKLRTIFTLFLHIFTLSGKKKYTSLSILFSFSFFFFNMISLEFSLFCKNTILDQAVIKTEIKKQKLNRQNKSYLNLPSPSIKIYPFYVRLPQAHKRENTQLQCKRKKLEFV